MKRTARALTIGAAACLAAVGSGSVQAQPQQPQTPRGWNYEVDQHGNRVPRANRVTKSDGSWREETRQGNCVTIKERSASGEYKETRQCNPANPG
jgi:hypothetical protein